jgi:tetratricopeptide (TPR) repeat protein
VLSGRILKLGDRLIVRTELIDVLNGWQMWGDQYYGQLSDTLAVQEQISGAISAKLKLKLSREEKERFSKRTTQDAEAFRLYLKGRYYWNKYTEPGLKKAIDYFEQAIEIDPTYALAYAGLADSYYRLSNAYLPTREAMPKAKAAALQALEIDETLSEAHASLGLINLFYEWEWSGAAQEFHKAIQSNPGNAFAHQRFGLYFNVLGRFDEAERQIKQAAALDPLSPQIQSSLGWTFFLSRRYQQAIEEIQKALEMDNSYEPALYIMGRAYEGLARYAESIAAFNKALSLNPVPMFLAGLGHVYAISGKSRLAHGVLSDLERQSAERYVSEYNKAVIHLALGDRERTFSCLGRAYEERCETMTLVKVDPFFDAIRTDIRFANLLRRIGLDDETLEIDLPVLSARAAN